MTTSNLDQISVLLGKIEANQETFSQKLSDLHTDSKKSNDALQNQGDKISDIFFKLELLNGETDELRGFVRELLKLKQRVIGALFAFIPVSGGFGAFISKLLDGAT